MIGGILTILIAIWVYRSSIHAKTGNAVFWTAGAALLFLTVQLIFYNVNIMIIDGLSYDAGEVYDRDLADVNDQKDENSTGGLQDGFFGGVIGVLFEIMPLFMAWLSVAFIRVKFMLKIDINVASLTSGIKETFISIGNSFKTKK